MTECNCSNKGLLYFSFFLAMILSKVGPTIARANTDPSASTGPSAAKSSPYKKQLKDYPPTRVSVVNALDNYFCSSEDFDKEFNLCERINYYNVVDDQVNSCYQERLMISFDSTLIAANFTPVAVTGFLKPYGKENSIEKTQKKSKICQLIKRYYVNEKEVIVQIAFNGENSIELLNNDEVDEFIQTQLVENSYYLLAFMSWLNMYNEKNNKYNLISKGVWDMTKIVVTTFVIIILLMKFLVQCRKKCIILQRLETCEEMPEKKSEKKKN